MKEKWWKDKSAEQQRAADNHDMQTYYNGLLAIYGPRTISVLHVKSADGEVTVCARNMLFLRI